MAIKLISCDCYRFLINHFVLFNFPYCGKKIFVFKQFSFNPNANLLAITKSSLLFPLQDLESLLSEIGCGKYLPLFQEQDIDLQIFLTLSEADLKEIGIKFVSRSSYIHRATFFERFLSSNRLFGPRRKMESAINRLMSDVRTGLSDRPEAAYADGLSAKLQVAESKLKQVIAATLFLIMGF